jgi:hypothetical protein
MDAAATKIQSIARGKNERAKISAPGNPVARHRNAPSKSSLGLSLDGVSQLPLADQVREHVRRLIMTTGQVDKYYSEEFETRAAEAFNDACPQGYTVLHDTALSTAVAAALGTAVDVDTLNELVTAYAFLDHSTIGPTSFGVRKESAAEFSRYYLASCLHAYFETPKVTPPGLGLGFDVLFIGGPYVARREALVARLVAEDMKVFEFPLITTNRAPERWEVDGVHHHFVTKFAFDATRDRGDFVAEWSLECGDYGVTLNALMAPRELHGKICLFPAPIDSEIGLQLRERDDVNVRSIYCAAPPEAQSQVKPDGSYIINPLVTQNSA